MRCPLPTARFASTQVGSRPIRVQERHRLSHATATIWWRGGRATNALGPKRLLGGKSPGNAALSEAAGQAQRSEGCINLGAMRPPDRARQPPWDRARRFRSCGGSWAIRHRRGATKRGWHPTTSRYGGILGKTRASNPIDVNSSNRVSTTKKQEEMRC